MIAFKHDGDIATCLRCEEMILPGESRVAELIRLFDKDEIRHSHRECFMRPIFGSVGHQLHKCSCYGGTEEDPPGLSRRQAAQASVDMFEQLNIADRDAVEELS